MASIYTIGHSTRPLGDLIATLQTHHIRTLVDIRAFPMSRRFPHFNRESLQEELPKLGIDYVWMKDLGGRRTCCCDVAAGQCDRRQREGALRRLRWVADNLRRNGIGGADAGAPHRGAGRESLR